MGLIGIGMFFDGFDLYLIATVLGAMLRSGFSTLGQNAQFIAATFLGMMLGSFATGFLGDRYGRRFTYQTNLAVFGFASLASAFAPNIHVLIFLRFIMGLGLGAENVVGYSTMTEFIPPQARGKWLGGMSFVVVLGLPATALVGTLVIPVFGWRAMFVIGGIGALAVWYLRKTLPESPRWLESVGRYDKAEALLQSIEAEVSQQHGALPPPSLHAFDHPVEKPQFPSQPGPVPPYDRRLHYPHHRKYSDLRIRDLASHILRSQRPHHRPIFQLLPNHLHRRTNRLRHWRINL